MRYVYLFHEGNARMKGAFGRQGGQPCGNDEHRPAGSLRHDDHATDACREYYNNGKKLLGKALSKRSHGI